MARGMKAGIRLTVAPLEAALARYDIDPEFLPTRLNGALRKARFNGFVTLAMADEFACEILKLHPLEVWGNEYEERVWFDMDDNEEGAA